ncbi:hypothetical protein BGW41_001159 [Actinomortierella wolfii]|nr:hypothetical protein BGW41_001159 [Actinomortierella wolfii]
MMFKLTSIVATLAVFVVTAQAAHVTFSSCSGEVSVQDLDPGVCFQTRSWRKTNLCTVESDRICRLYEDANCGNEVASGTYINAYHIRQNDSIRCD